MAQTGTAGGTTTSTHDNFFEDFFEEDYEADTRDELEDSVLGMCAGCKPHTLPTSQKRLRPFLRISWGVAYARHSLPLYAQVVSPPYTPPTLFRTGCMHGVHVWRVCMCGGAGGRGGVWWWCSSGGVWGWLWCVVVVVCAHAWVRAWRACVWCVCVCGGGRWLWWRWLGGGVWWCVVVVVVEGGGK